MNIEGKVVFVSGTNRGLGKAFAQALLAGGAAKVYAGARDPGKIDLPGVEPVQLDLTASASIAAAAARCGDVQLLINNAGIFAPGNLLDAGAADSLRRHFDTNLFGQLSLIQAFAPILQRNGGGAIVNILSVLSWVALPGTAPYSVSKAAFWQLSNGLRNELRAQNTRVVAVHPAYIDTDMAAGANGPKTQPEDVVRSVLQGLAQGVDEILVDDTGRAVKQSLSTAQPYYLGTGVAQG